MTNRNQSLSFQQTQQKNHDALVAENIRLRQELATNKMYNFGIDNLRTANTTLMHQNADLTRENESLKFEISNLKLKLDAVWHSADLANDTIKYITHMIQSEHANGRNSYPLVKVSQYITQWRPSPPTQFVPYSSAQSADKKVSNNAHGITPAQNTKDQSTMPTDTSLKDPSIAADQELPAPGANAGDTAEDTDKPSLKDRFEKLKEEAGEAIDKAQEKLGLERGPRDVGEALLHGAQALRDSLTPRPLSEFLNDVISAVKTAKEKEEGTLSVTVEVMVQERGNAAKLAFTL